MENRNKIQKYVTAFRNLFSNYLRPSVGMKFSCYPVLTQGALIEINIDSGVQNEEIYYPPSSTIAEAISKIDQVALKGDLSKRQFTGTGLILAKGKITLIKGSDSDIDWNVIGVKKDIEFIMRISTQQQKKSAKG